MWCITSAETAKISKALEKGLDSVELSLDLGLTRESVSTAQFKSIDLSKVREGSIYALEGKKLLKLAMMTEHYFRLVPTDGAPALEIDGIRMHVTKEGPPQIMARKWLSALRVSKGLRVLDVCTGLGYTAMEAAGRGAKVTTIEKYTEVVELAKMSPWSAGLFDNPSIEIIIGDAAKELGRLPGNSFDFIIHDPPSFAIASELYTEGLYSDMHRVSKRGARLFHYVGSPGRRRGVDISKGIVQRLQRAGWAEVKKEPALLGIIARA